MRVDDFNISEADMSVLKAIRTVARPILVGGCVRDVLLGLTSKDVDVEVHDLKNMDALIEVLQPFGNVDEIGKAFGVIKLRGLDISLPRLDSLTGVGHTGFTVKTDMTLSLEEAASRRDFTINTMMFDPFTEEFIDLFNGRQDLDNRILRHTSDAFADDPLRVLRGVQFAARFNMDMDPLTVEVCKGLMDQFCHISTERVWTEFEKILSKGVSFRKGLKVLRDTGWVQHFPELKTVKGDKTELAIIKVQDQGKSFKLPVVLATLIAESSHSNIKSIGAPVSIERPAIRLAFAISESSRIQTLTDVRKMARKLEPLSIFQLLHASPSTQLNDLATTAGVMHEPLKPLVTGFDLIALGIEPGPIFKTLLDFVIDRQDEGQFNTPKEALAWLDSEGKVLVG